MPRGQKNKTKNRSNIVTNSIKTLKKKKDSSALGEISLELLKAPA